MAGFVGKATQPGGLLKPEIARFATRQAEYLWDESIHAWARADDTLKVTAERSLWWEPFATVRTPHGGQVTQSIVHLVHLDTCLMPLGLLGIIALARGVHADSVAAAMDWRMLVPPFLIYGLGQGLAQPGLINTVIGSSGGCRISGRAVPDDGAGGDRAGRDGARRCLFRLGPPREQSAPSAHIPALAHC
jgi:hypothetical protein